MGEHDREPIAGVIMALAAMLPHIAKLLSPVGKACDAEPDLKLVACLTKIKIRQREAGRVQDLEITLALDLTAHAASYQRTRMGFQPDAAFL